MRSLRKLRGHGWREDKSFTTEDVKRIRESLEESTRDAFYEFDRAQRACLAQAQNYVLD